MDADGKNPRQILHVVVGTSSLPAWSPDGKQIAFQVGILRGSDIYIMDTDGQNPRRVTPNGTLSLSPAWSSDGKWIVYDATDRDIANPRENLNLLRHIFIVSVTGGEPRQITEHPQNYSPAWVPDSPFSVSPTVDTQTTLWGRLKQAEHITPN